MFASQGMVSAAKNADRKEENFGKELLVEKEVASTTGDYTKLRKMLMGHLVESAIIIGIIVGLILAALMLNSDFKTHPSQASLKIISGFLGFCCFIVFFFPAVLSIIRDINGLKWIKKQPKKPEIPESKFDGMLHGFHDC